MSRADRSAVRYRELFRDREFVALFVADTASRTGSHLGRFALAALVYHRTGSLSATSATFAVTYLPGILAGPILSTLADRLPRKPLLVACDLLRAALIAVIAFGDPPVWSALALLLLVELVKVPFGAARIALLADILKGDRLVAGTALVSASQQAVQIAGFALGGLVVAALGPKPALVVDMASYAVSALLLAALIRRRPAPSAADAGPAGRPGRMRPLRDTAEGIRVVCRTGRLPTMFWLLTLGPTVLATAEGLAIPYATVLGAEDAAGLLLAAVPFGTVLGLAIVGKLSRHRREKVLIPFSLTVGLCVALAGTVAHPVVVCCVLFVAGVAMGHFAHVQASIVELIAPEVRGRIVGLANTALNLGQGVAALLAGVVAELWSIPAVLICSGIATATGVLVLSVFGAPYAGRHRADPRMLRRERRRVRRVRTAAVTTARPAAPRRPGMAPPTFSPRPSTTRGAVSAPTTRSTPPATTPCSSAPTPGPLAPTRPAAYPPPLGGAAARSYDPPFGAAAALTSGAPTAPPLRTTTEGRPADPLARPGAPRPPLFLPRR